MALFGKKKSGPTCTCQNNGPTFEAAEVTKVCCPESKSGIRCIKVLGMGCSSCHTQYENARTAIASTGLSIEVEYVTDPEQIMSYGAMSMPAVVVNEQVVTMGKVLSAAALEKLLHKLGF